MNEAVLAEPTLDDYLAADGPLAALLDGYQPRDVQIEMAHAVEHAIVQKQCLLVEAGTGTGKTFAYLLPAILSGTKVIVSTASKNLQDQLYQKDIPLLQKLFNKRLQVALLKGRANYLCHYRVESAMQSGRFFNQEIASQVQVVREAMAWVKQGDIAEISALPEDAAVWPSVTSTADNCLQQDCPFYTDCFVVKARKQAQCADLVIVNHHLFFADVGLREQGFAELLPAAGVIIFDEAHQLAETASQYFGTSISSRQLLELGRDVQAEVLQHAKDMHDIIDHTDNLKQQVQNMRLAFAIDEGRGAWLQVAKQKAMQTAVLAVQQVLQQMEQGLSLAAERHKALAACWRRCTELIAQFGQLTQDQQTQQIHWYETFRRAFILHHTPFSVAEKFQQLVQAHQGSWILTSATLTVANRFTHVAEQLGLAEAETLQLNSPFDFKKQALLYLPRGIPDPRHADFHAIIFEKAVQLIQLSRGRTFFLFTSHRALKLAAEYLASQLEFPVLVQGTQPKANLIKQFRQAGNAVLLGTQSFWQGVDVRGQALSCVIIDKLPFVSPRDPVEQARIKMIEKQGKSAFDDYQIPKAVINLKQGVGRLIRDSSDCGVICLCDPRFIGRHYARWFWQSLPAMAVTRDIDTVREFFDETVNA